jgi:carboxypeptidase D
MRGSLFYDPVISSGAVQDDIPSAQMVDYWKPMFNLNDTFLKSLNDASDKCGYTDFINTAMTFPPAGPLPAPPQSNDPECSTVSTLSNATLMCNVR